MPTDWTTILFPETPTAPRPAPGPYTPQGRTEWQTGLDPQLVAKAQQLKALAAQEGIDLAITAGHRSKEEQARLYAQGRSAPGGIITYAKPGTSRHESGRAIDVVPLGKDGKPDWRSPHWSRLGALGQSLGLEWGGTWKKLNDRPHFQLPADTTRDTPPAGTIPGSERLTAAFRTKVDQVAGRLRMDPQHLLTVMSFETGGTFDPAKRNEAGSGATGLIQFLPATATRLGTSTAALAGMTPEQQLDYVERYLKPYAGRMRTQQDAYLAVLNPSAMGTPASHVLFSPGSRAYDLNKALDTEQKGYVTVGDTTASLGRFTGTRGTAPPTVAGTDWVAALGLDSSQAAPAAPRDWVTALGLSGSAPSPPAPPGPPRSEGAPSARAWEQELFATPPPDPAAFPGGVPGSGSLVAGSQPGTTHQQPGTMPGLARQAARDWGAVLFGA